MEGRSGYEYSYGMFWMDDTIIQEYRSLLGGRKREYLFEIGTNFKLKRSSGEVVILGSEMFGESVKEGDGGSILAGIIRFRLSVDYGMSEDQIQSLARAAVDFAAAADKSLAVVPVAVGLDVLTVQQPGEAIEAVIDRAIKPESLIPIYVWPLVRKSIRKTRDNDDLNIHMRTWSLMRKRVENEQELGVMKVCPVCSRNSIIGAQISVLPCGHYCHSICIFRWLFTSSACPVCAVPIPLHPDYPDCSDDDENDE